MASNSCHGLFCLFFSIYLQIIFQRNVSFFFPKSSISSTAETQDRWEPVLVHWPLSVIVNITPVSGISFTPALDTKPLCHWVGRQAVPMGVCIQGCLGWNKGFWDCTSSRVKPIEMGVLSSRALPLKLRSRPQFLLIPQLLCIWQDFFQFSWVYKLFI